LERRLGDLSLSARIHQRYRVIAEVRAGRPVAEAAERAGCHFTRAYAWVRRFNQSGFATFELATNPHGRPPILRAEQLRELVEVALSSPAERGLPYSAWSVAKLAAYCRKRKILPEISDEWVRRLLRRDGLSAQRVKPGRRAAIRGSTKKGGHPPGSISGAHRGPG
jgi:transposase